MRKHIDISRAITNFLMFSKQKDRTIRGNCNLLTKVKFHELVRRFLIKPYGNENWQVKEEDVFRQERNDARIVS